MKIATISNTKNGLSKYLQLVKDGEVVLIMDRDQPVAKLCPLSGGVPGDENYLLYELEKKGWLRLPEESNNTGWIDELRFKNQPKKTTGAVAALLQERESGR